MAETGGHIDNTLDLPAYSAAEDAVFFNLLSRGVVPDVDNELEVKATAGLEISIDSGAYISDGYFKIQDEHADGADPLLKTLDAEAAGWSRIDNIVVEFDLLNDTYLVKVSKGVGTAGAPAAPALVDTDTKWEVLLATCLVTVGVLTSVTDGRSIVGARYKIQDLEVDDAQLAVGAVSATKYADDSIALAKMKANSVDSPQYVDGSIDLIHMSANSVDSDQYVDGSIDLIHMSANSVDSDQYVDGSIDTIHIAAKNITDAKLADGIKITHDVLPSEEAIVNVVFYDDAGAEPTASDYAKGTLLVPYTA